jgi:hypothetical protein
MVAPGPVGLHGPEVALCPKLTFHPEMCVDSHQFLELYGAAIDLVGTHVLIVCSIVLVAMIGLARCCL